MRVALTHLIFQATASAVKLCEQRRRGSGLALSFFYLVIRERKKNTESVAFTGPGVTGAVPSNTSTYVPR